MSKRSGGQPLTYRQRRWRTSSDGTPWPRTELEGRLEAWGVGRAAQLGAWLEGTAVPDDAIGEAILAMPLLWRAVLLQRAIAGQTIEDTAGTIGASTGATNNALIRAMAAMHGYLVAVDPNYREHARAHDLTITVSAYRPARPGPVDPAD